MFGNLFAPLAMKISGGLIAFLLVALALVMWRADAISEDRERLRNSLATETANHAVTRASVANLKGVLERYVGAGQAAQVAQMAAVEAQADKSAALRAKADRLRGMIDELGPEEPCDCSTPDFVMGEQ